MTDESTVATAGAGRRSCNAETLTTIASMAPNSFNASFMLRSQVKTRPEWPRDQDLAPAQCRRNQSS
jgi:hypothetical protein